MCFATSVKGTCTRIRAAILLKAHIFPAFGPLPFNDVELLGSAALQLLKTLDPGIKVALVLYTNTENVVSTGLTALCEV